MLGPSVCVMCGENTENLEHLLNKFSIADFMWHNLPTLFQQTVRNKESIQHIIENCRRGGYQSPVVNGARSLLVGFLLWVFCKERNMRMFQDEKR